MPAKVPVGSNWSTPDNTDLRLYAKVKHQIDLRERDKWKIEFSELLIFLCPKCTCNKKTDFISF
jgi:hypothetical protein